MSQYNPVLKFIRKHLWSQTITTGLAHLDSCIKVPKNGATLVEAESYSGATALFLDFAVEYSKTGLVIYVDCPDSVYFSRIPDMTVENFIHFCPSDPQQILDFVSSSSHAMEEPLIIIDSFYLFRSISPELSLSNVVRNVKQMLPKATILVNVKYSTVTENIYNQTIKLKLKKNFYISRELVGHFVEVGKSEHFVSHKSGRFSKVYDYLAVSLEAGKQKNDLFYFDGIRTQGFWSTLKHHIS